MVFLGNPVIAACWVVFIVYWIVKAFDVKRTLERHWGWRLAWIPVMIAFVLVVAGHSLGPSLGTQLWPRSLPVELLADLLAVTGVVVLVWARRTLGRNWSAAVVIKEKHELVTSGPYAYVRHPIYSGVLLLVLGTVIALADLVGVVFLVFVALGIWSKAHWEERLMRKRFPKEYPKYKARVKAIIPRVL